MTNEGRIFSGETKRVQINLSALTRMEYGEEVIVPAEFNNNELEDLVSRAYEDIDGTKFNNNPDYWEKGSCWHEIIKENTNCLAGMRCPKCFSLGPFKLATKGPDPELLFNMRQMELYRAVENGDIAIREYMAAWHDDGSEDTGGDTEFVLDGEGECLSCGHAGLVKNFKSF